MRKNLSRRATNLEIWSTASMRNRADRRPRSSKPCHANARAHSSSLLCVFNDDFRLSRHPQRQTGNTTHESSRCQIHLGTAPTCVRALASSKYQARVRNTLPSAHLLLELYGSFLFGNASDSRNPLPSRLAGFQFARISMRAKVQRIQDARDRDRRAIERREYGDSIPVCRR